MTELIIYELTVVGLSTDKILTPFYDVAYDMTGRYERESENYLKTCCCVCALLHSQAFSCGGSSHCSRKFSKGFVKYEQFSVHVYQDPYSFWLSPKWNIETLAASETETSLKGSKNTFVNSSDVTALLQEMRCSPLQGRNERKCQ